MRSLFSQLLAFRGPVVAIGRPGAGLSRGMGFLKKCFPEAVGVFSSMRLHGSQSLFFAQKSLSPRVPELGTAGDKR